MFYSLKGYHYVNGTAEEFTALVEFALCPHMGLFIARVINTKNDFQRFITVPPEQIEIALEQMGSSVRWAIEKEIDNRYDLRFHKLIC